MTCWVPCAPDYGCRELAHGFHNRWDTFIAAAADPWSDSTDE
jgi:hypothetical protein